MDGALISAEDAAHRLGVSRKTLYTYVSRGWLTSMRGPDGRSRRYLEAEVERLRHRAESTRGHRAVATTALAHGQPVIDTAISHIDMDGPSYRGRPLHTLLDHGFEAVCAVLYGSLPLDEPRERPCADLQHPHQAWLAALAGGSTSPVHTLAETFGPRRATVAETFGPHPCIDRALIVCADHGLNASTFAVRVAASTGAPLAFAVAAGVAAHAGPRHGGLSQQTESLVDAWSDVPRHRRRAWLSDRAANALLPGFSHPLYPRGDPRAAMLIEGLPLDDDTGSLLETVAELGLPAPNLDGGLVAMRRACGLPRGAATAIFGVGRCAGWVAHALEASEGPLLRPRSRYRP